MIYLASPYTHEDPLVREARFRSVARQVVRLLTKGVFVWSPIVNTHVLGQFAKLPTEFDFWADFDTDILKRCEKLLVYKMPGWDKSLGIAAEVEFAINNNILVEYIEWTETDGNADATSAAAS